MRFAFGVAAALASPAVANDTMAMLSTGDVQLNTSELEILILNRNEGSAE